MIIYLITNLVNQKVYVGQTIYSADKRFKQHCRIDKGRACPLMQRAIAKYGKENFCIETLETCSSKEELNERETYWINTLNSCGENGYNLTFGGARPALNEESRKKISEKLKGKPNGKKGIPTHHIPWNKGIVWSDIVRTKMSASAQGPKPWLLGRKQSEEHKSKLSKAHIGKPLIKKWKPLICKETGEVFKSVNHAAEKLGLQKSKISNVLHGKRSHTGGYTFQLTVIE